MKIKSTHYNDFYFQGNKGLTRRNSTRLTQHKMLMSTSTSTRLLQSWWTLDTNRCAFRGHNSLVYMWCSTHSNIMHTIDDTDVGTREKNYCPCWRKPYSTKHKFQREGRSMVKYTGKVLRDAKTIIVFGQTPKSSSKVLFELDYFSWRPLLLC